VNGPGLEGEYLGVTILAAIHTSMDLVAESDVGDTLYLEADILRFHSPMTVAAVAGHGKSLFPVMAGATGFPLFHLRHGDVLFLAGDHLAVVAALALASGLGYVHIVAEDHIAQPLDLVVDITGFSLVAASAIFFGSDTEGLDAGMAGTARLGLFHFRHGEALALLQIVNGVVTNPAIVVIFTEVNVMAEYHRISVGETVLDVLGFLGVRHDGQEEG